MKLKNEYLNLLAQRESGVVLGKKWFNLWLLTAVLTAIFLSIAFSNGSMIYLSEKMNDPFTNWVNITNGFGSDKFDEFRNAILDSTIQKHYGFSDVQSDNYFSYNMLGKNNKIHYLQCRFFERLNCNLVKAILSEDNVINGCAIPDSLLQNETFGFIITLDVLHKLGYDEKNIPAYINYVSFSRGADTFGVKMIDEEHAAAPVPLLGVVRRLPMNMDMIAAMFFYEQETNDYVYPLSMNNEQYQRELIYFVDKSVPDDEFKNRVKSIVPDSLNCDVIEDNQPKLDSWKEGKLMSVYVGDVSTPTSVIQAVNAAILAKFPEEKITRIYKYETQEKESGTTRNFVSVNFLSLDSIRAFERYAKDNFNVQIEMSQVNSKENFNAVSVMAIYCHLPSSCLLSFALLCSL